MKSYLLPILIFTAFVIGNIVFFISGYRTGYLYGSQNATKATVNWYNTNIFGPVIKLNELEKATHNQK